MPAVEIEEFYNRVHGKGGRFSTSGTGGGHFAGRGHGGKRPALKKGSSAPAASSQGSGPSKGHSGIKAKGSLAERLAAVTAKTATKKKETLRRLADKKGATPSKALVQAHGSKVAHNLVNAIGKKGSTPGIKPTVAAKPKQKAETMDQRIARITAQRNESKAKAAKAKSEAPKAAAQSAHDKGALDAINKVRAGKETGTKQAYAEAHKTEAHTAPAGPKQAQAKQDSGKKAPANKQKIKLSDRLKNAAAFAKKVGEGVVKDNMTTSQYNSYKKSHDSSFKGERLTLRNSLLTGRQQRQS